MESINIQGKPYVMVNTRIKEFRTNPKFKDYGLVTTKTLDEWFKSKNSKGQIIDENRVEFRCEITNASGAIVSSGTARELKSSTFINKKSHIENCETSAVGRALGNLGIGIDTSVASAEEVLNAVKNQPAEFTDERQWLTETQFQRTLGGTQEQAKRVLREFRMKKIYKDKITNKFKL